MSDDALDRIIGVVSDVGGFWDLDWVDCSFWWGLLVFVGESCDLC